jgi:hypothetical protein
VERNSHKADVKEIKRLYREGYSLVRIRHTPRLSITLTRIMGIVKDGDGSSDRRENLC